MFSIPVDVTSFPTTFWDVLTAFGTVGTAGLAGWAIRRESKLRQENEKLRKKEEKAASDREDALSTAQQAHDRAARRAQAELVIAWFQSKREDTDTAGGYVPLATLVNQSKGPVFDVVIEATRKPYPDPALEGLATHQSQWSSETKTVLIPTPVPDTEYMYADDGVRCVAVSPGWKMSVTFRDLAGIRWRRHDTGQLDELT